MPRTRTIILAALLALATLAARGLPAADKADGPKDEKKRFEALCDEFQDPAKAEAFAEDAAAFLRDFPVSNFKVRAEYMLALREKDLKTSSALLERVRSGEAWNSQLSASALFVMGQRAYGQKDYASSEKHFKALTGYYTLSYYVGEGLYGLTLSQLGLGKWADAQSTLKKLVSRYPAYEKQEKIAYAAGYIAYKLGKYQQAYDKFSVLKSTEALFYQAKCLEKQQKYIPAVVAYKQLLADFPGIPFKEKVRFSVADCFYSAGDYVSAMQEYNAFITMFPSSPWVVNARYKTGCCHYLRKDYPKAAEVFSGIVGNDPKCNLAASSQYMLGETYAAQGSLDSALAEYDKVTKQYMLSAAAPKAYYKIGWTQTRKNSYEAAINAFKVMIAQFPGDDLVPYARYLIAENYRRMGDFEQAVEYYRQVLSNPSPDRDLTEVTFFMIAKTFYNQKKYGDIVSNYRYIFQKQPDRRSEWSPYTYLMMGEAYYYSGLYTEAVKMYDKVTSSNTLGVPASLAKEGRAWSYFQAEEYQKALKERELLRDDWLVQHSADAKMRNEFEFGDIYFNQKEYMEALDSFEKFVQAYPSSDLVPDALFNAGRCYYKLAYYTYAVETWDKLITNYRSSPHVQEAQGLIADTYFRSQKYPQAVQAYRRIISEYPGSELAQKAQLRIGQCYFNAMDDRAAVSEFRTSIASAKDDETRDAAVDGLLAAAGRIAESNPGTDEDIAILEQTIAANPKSKRAADMQYRVAERHYDRKEYAKAAEEFRRVVSDFPAGNNAPSALFYQAESLYRAASYEDAVGAYTRFIDNYPKNESVRVAYLHLANSLYYLEKYPEAAKKYRELTMLGREEDEIVMTAYLNASLCYKKAEDWDNVIAINREFIKWFPKDPRARDAAVEIADAYEVQRQYGKVIETYQDMLKVMPDSDTLRIELQYKIAEFYLKQDNLEAGKLELKKLLLAQPLDNPWRLSGIARLAQEYENAKQPGDAVKMYEEIIRSTSDPKWVSVSQDRITAIEKDIQDNSKTP